MSSCLVTLLFSVLFVMMLFTSWPQTSSNLVSSDLMAQHDQALQAANIVAAGVQKKIDRVVGAVPSISYCPGSGSRCRQAIQSARSRSGAAAVTTAFAWNRRSQSGSADYQVKHSDVYGIVSDARHQHGFVAVYYDIFARAQNAKNSLAAPPTQKPTTAVA